MQSIHDDELKDLSCCNHCLSVETNNHHSYKNVSTIFTLISNLLYTLFFNDGKNTVNTLYTAFLRALFAGKRNSLCAGVIGPITFNALYEVRHNN